MAQQDEITFPRFIHFRPLSFKAVFVFSILLMVLISIFLNSGSVHAAASTPNVTCKQWNYVSSPSPNTGDSLYGVAAISSSDVWSVGITYNSNGSLPLAEHYDGTQWSVVPTPTPTGASAANFSGIAAISTNDVWAVGGYSGSNFTNYTLVEHWDGSTWNIVPSPTPGSGQDAFFNAVTAVSATDVWAVGQYDSNTLIEHWNGSTWNVVSSPTPGSAAQLLGVSAISSTNVWAVGYYDSSTGIPSFIEQWNGSTWNIVQNPNPSGVGAGLTGVSAVSATNIWAVGFYYPSSKDSHAFIKQWHLIEEHLPTSGSGQSLTLIEHWDGTSWSVVNSPSPSNFSGFSGVAAISNKNIWAVGSYSLSGGQYYSLIEHWNGKQWKIVPASKPGSSSSTLSAIASIPSTSSLWAAGSHKTRTLTEYYC